MVMVQNQNFLALFYHQVVVVDSARIEEILLLPISRHCLRATNFLLRAKTWAGRVRKWREDNIWRRI